MSKNNQKDFLKEEKYRAKMVKSKKGWLVKGLLFSTFLTGGMVTLNSETVQANEWQANSVEMIKSKITKGQSSYTFEEGDTFYNISLAVNVKWQTLMEANGFEIGSQYTVPVGTTITFDGSKMTVTDSTGKVVSETKLTDNDKVNKEQTFANQPSDTQKNTGQKNNNVTTNKTGNKKTVEQQTNNGKKVDPKQDKESVQKAKEEAEKKKKAEEEKLKKLEEEKKEEERKLTSLLNNKNETTLKNLNEKRANIVASIESIKIRISEQQQQLVVVEGKISEALVAKEAAEKVVASAQVSVTAAQAKVAEANNQVASLQTQINQLKNIAIEKEDMDAQTRLNTLENELVAAQGNLTSVTAELNQANESVVSANVTLNSANDFLTGTLNDKASIEAQLLDLSDELNFEESELATLPTSVTSKNSEEAKKIQNNLAKLEKDINISNEIIAELDQEIEELTEIISEIEGEVVLAKDDLEKMAEVMAKEVDTGKVDDMTNKIKDKVKDIEKELPEIKDNRPEKVNIEKNIDLEGNQLTSIEGYELVETKELDVVVTTENGKVTHTYTTLNIYKKKNELTPLKRTEERHVDEEDNLIEGDLKGYIEVSRKEPELQITKEGNQIIHTYVTIITYHKVVNEDKEVVINVDESGKKIVDLEGYELVEKGERVQAIETKDNGDTVTTYTTTNVYKKKEIVKRYVTKNIDEMGKEIKGDLSDYTLLSVEEPQIEKSEESGKIIHTYVTIKIYRKNDLIIKTIIDVNDDRIPNIKKQLLEDRVRVSIQQAAELTNMELNNMVADYFTVMVNEERMKYNDPKINVTQDEKVKKEISSRAVEVMYKFDHEKMPDTRPGEDNFLERLPGEKAMILKQSTENISKAFVSKSKVNNDSRKLAEEIAKGMFDQYIDNERISARSDDPYSNENGHYRNIIMNSYSDIVVAVYVVESGSYYNISTTVATGNSRIVK